MRIGQQLEAYEVDEKTAREMAAIGIIPTLDIDPIGMRVQMAGQWFTAGPEATREEWLQKLAEVIPHSPVFEGQIAADLLAGFRKCPSHYKFQRYYTD